MTPAWCPVHCPLWRRWTALVVADAVLMQESRERSAAPFPFIGNAASLRKKATPSATAPV